MLISPQIPHPSALLNKCLLEMVRYSMAVVIFMYFLKFQHPDAAMVITEDADWISVIADVRMPKKTTAFIVYLMPLDRYHDPEPRGDLFSCFGIP